MTASQNHVSRFIGIALGCACLAAAFVVHRAPPVPAAAVDPIPSSYLTSRRANAEDDALLERPVSAMDVDGVPLATAIERLSEKADVPMNVDWSGLGAKGLPREAVVDVHIEAGKLSAALGAIVQSLIDQGYPSLEFHPEGGCIWLREAGDPTGPFAATRTECINLRHTLDLINVQSRSQWIDPNLDLADSLEELLATTPPDQGWLYVIGTALVVERTSDNLATVHSLIDALDTTLVATDCRAILVSNPTANRPEVETSTVFYNVDGLVEYLEKQHVALNRGELIRSALIRRLPDGAQELLTNRSFHYLGSVLAITDSTENVRTAMLGMNALVAEWKMNSAE